MQEKEIIVNILYDSDAFFAQTIGLSFYPHQLFVFLKGKSLCIHLNYWSNVCFQC